MFLATEGLQATEVALEVTVMAVMREESNDERGEGEDDDVA